MLQLEQIQWQTDGSALLRLSNSEEVRILALSVTELSLYGGQQLSPDLLEQIQSAGRFREIYKKSLDLLARREHSIWELRQKLRQRFPGFREVEPVLLQLEEQKFLCDERFSLNFVHSRMANRSWGAYRLRAELKQRGVAGQWIDQALASEVAGATPVLAGSGSTWWVRGHFPNLQDKLTDATVVLAKTIAAI